MLVAINCSQVKCAEFSEFCFAAKVKHVKFIFSQQVRILEVVFPLFVPYVLFLQKFVSLTAKFI